MDISILIPTCNRPEALKTCLHSLKGQLPTSSATSFEVLVSDDGTPSDCSTLSAAAGCEVKYSIGPRRGPAANRNGLARSAQGNLLIFLDDDCLPCDGLVRSYLDAEKAHSDIDVFEGGIKSDRKLRFAHEESPVNQSGGYLWSANMAVRRSAFLELGGFDEEFPFAAMEDVEFRTRVQKSGRRILWCPEAVVMHPVEARGERIRQIKHRYSVLMYLHKHPDRLEWIRPEFTLLSCLRVIKHRLIKRGLLQPIDAYRFLGYLIENMLVIRRILRHPESLERERAKLGTHLGLKTT